MSSTSYCDDAYVTELSFSSSNVSNNRPEAGGAVPGETTGGGLTIPDEPPPELARDLKRFNELPILIDNIFFYLR